MDDRLYSALQENTVAIERFSSNFESFMQKMDLHMGNYLDSASKIERVVQAVEHLPDKTKLVIVEEMEEMGKEMRALKEVIKEYNENEKMKAKRKFWLDLIKTLLPFVTGAIGIFLGKKVI